MIIQRCSNRCISMIGVLTAGTRPNRHQPERDPGARRSFLSFMRGVRVTTLVERDLVIPGACRECLFGKDYE